MAGNVFGNPVNNAFVKSVYPNVEEITPELRAKVAVQYMSADGRNVDCKNFVHNIQKQISDKISTLCMIFNATGDTLTYVDHHDWEGRIYKTPVPVIVQNGQWAGFVHKHYSVPETGSESAIVFRGKNSAGNACDWMLSWSNPDTGKNRVSSTFLVITVLYFFLFFVTVLLNFENL